jgi:group I intron endonuclease
MKSYVYKITNLVNNKTYIGKSNDPHDRWIRHLQQANLKEDNVNFSIIHKAIKKYGENNFNFEIIGEFNSELEAFEAETYFIDLYSSHISKNGYNITLGGEGISGYKHTEESRQKMSIAHTGKIISPETKKKMSDSHIGENNYFFGKTHSEEVKQQLREINIGKSLTEETKQKISQGNIEYWSTHEHPNLGRQLSQEHINKLSKANTGENNPTAKLNNTEVIEIKKLISAGWCNQDIALTFSVPTRLIGRIRNGETWSHINIEEK